MTKKFLFTILFLLLAVNGWTAELLVKAKPHWMDSFTQADVDKMTVGQEQSYEVRSQIGDIIVVRPDGWKWGKEECLPNYVVIKIPDLSIEEAEKYQEQLREEFVDESGKSHSYMIRERKYSLPKIDIKTAKANKLNSFSLTKPTLENIVITKMGSPDEVIQPNKNITLYHWRQIAKKIIPYFKTAYNFYIKKCYAAQFLYKTVKPADGDYTSLEACLDANEQDLTGDGWFDIEISGDWTGSPDTTAASVNNYTLTADDYINIYVLDTDRHAGVLDLSKYNMSQTGWATPCLDIAEEYVTVTGLQGKSTSGSASGNPLISAVGYDYVIIDKCIAYECKVFSFHLRAVTAFGAVKSYIKNSIAYDGTSIGFQLTNNFAAYNCTAVDNGNYGFYYGSGGAVATNCLATGSGTADFHASVTETYCASEDASADDATSNASITMTNLYADEAGDDFHLQSGTTAEVVDAGADLSGSMANARGEESTSDDIDGDARSGTWDIGADEYVSEEPPPTRRVIMISELIQ